MGRSNSDVKPIMKRINDKMNNALGREGLKDDYLVNINIGKPNVAKAFK